VRPPGPGNVGESKETTMNPLAKTGTMWIVRGIASVLFGVLTVMRPGASIAAIVLLYGVYALTDGALLLGFAFRIDTGKAPYIFRGLISIAAGVVTFLYPGLAATSLYLLIGAWAMIAGVTELGIAIAARKEMTNVGALVLAGVLSLACGVALLVLPAAGVVALVSLIAAYAIVNGIALIGAGIRIHQFFRPLQHAT
jgi:uncharacterized membrane protein HdeD (DUF308 family)